MDQEYLNPTTIHDPNIGNPLPKGHSAPMLVSNEDKRNAQSVLLQDASLPQLQERANALIRESIDSYRQGVELRLVEAEQRFRDTRVELEKHASAFSDMVKEALGRMDYGAASAKESSPDCALLLQVTGSNGEYVLNVSADSRSSKEKPRVFVRLDLASITPQGTIANLLDNLRTAKEEFARAKAEKNNVMSHEADFVKHAAWAGFAPNPTPTPSHHARKVKREEDPERPSMNA